MRIWCKHPDDDSHCTAKPKFRPRTGLPKTKTAKVPMCKTNIWVYSLQCFCIFQPNQVDTAQDASNASVIHTSWSEFLCWPAHCCSTPASGAWKPVADVNNSFSQNFGHVGLSPETTFAFFDFFDRRRKQLWLGLLITISVPNVSKITPFMIFMDLFSTSQPSYIQIHGSHNDYYIMMHHNLLEALPILWPQRWGSNAPRDVPPQQCERPGCQENQHLGPLWPSKI